MDEIDDRRGSGRVYIMTTATLEFDGHTVQATAMDLSLSGLAVWAPEGATPGGNVLIKMEIDGQGIFEVDATLARQFESDGGAVWGLAFQGIDAAKHARLDAYLKTLE